jgi:acetoin:2,6-dichlorophenolindophenol oxidoreductase subunit alpha
MDLWLVYRQMLRSRLLEEAVAVLWEHGLISGEMHLGTGEEAIIAGAVLQLKDGDAMALDHRGTAALLMRGVDPVLLLREFLGQPDGLCKGMGGHMHLFAPELLAASSGIVGASGPAAAGFALASQYLRPGAVSVAFFGEGATNQGMLLESLNLAAAWQLPVLFVCKDNAWEITTQFSSVSHSGLAERARGFGMTAVDVDGCNVEAVWEAARKAIQLARQGGGPSFLHTSCVHLQGHFLGDQLLRLADDPFSEMKTTTLPMMRSFLRRRGAPLSVRVQGIRHAMTMISQAPTRKAIQKKDPLLAARIKLESYPEQLLELETAIQLEIQQVTESALSSMLAQEGNLS